MRPTENAATEEKGELAAEYELFAGEDKIGEINVWSHGSYRARVGALEKTVIRVGFDIQNTSDKPIVFVPESTRIATLKINKRELKDLPVSVAQGSYVIQPRSEGEIDAYFILPDGIDPQNVDQFSLFWTVNTGGEAYSEFTPFEEYDDYGYYADRPFYGPYPYAYDPFYDPLYYDPWAWQYYRPTYVVAQQPGVIVRQPAQPGRVREHGKEVRTPSSRPH